jgi:hypothetical protein
MLIPLETDAEPTTTPWTFAMALAEQGQLATKVHDLLQADRPDLEVAILEVDVVSEVVNVALIVNGAQQPPLSIPAWRRTNSLSAYPADYVAKRLKALVPAP